MHSLPDIEARTRALMASLGQKHLGRPLSGWSFRFDRARRRLGLCTWKRGERLVRQISLSGPLAEALGWDVMEDVARHEIAHALDYETRGRSAHDAAWKAWARRCGADPTAAYDGPLPDDGTSKIVATCPGCGYERPFHRTPTRAYVCPTCRPRVYLRIAERASGRVIRDGGAEPGLFPAARWVATCPSCGICSGRQRRPTRRLACADCCRRHAGGRFDPNYELTFERAGDTG